MLDYINTLSAEKTFILEQGRQLTIEQEQDFLKEMLTAIENKKAVMLLAFSGETLIGISDISRRSGIHSHIGSFGISIAKDFRGQGIGKLLMQKILAEAIATIPGLSIIKLAVFSNNPVGINLYKKLGFIEYGRLPKGIQHRGEFVDDIFMYKPIA